MDVRDPARSVPVENRATCSSSSAHGLVAFAAALALRLMRSPHERCAARRPAESEGTISGYTSPRRLHWRRTRNIDSVAFTLNSAATTVKAKLIQSSSTRTNCSVSGTSVTCDLAGRRGDGADEPRSSPSARELPPGKARAFSRRTVANADSPIQP